MFQEEKVREEESALEHRRKELEKSAQRLQEEVSSISHTN